MQSTIGITSIKIVVIGDGLVGKTCILSSYKDQKFPEYVPTVFDNYQKIVEIDKVKVQLNIWDTAGQEGYEHQRKLSYSGVNAFIIVFSIIDQISFENAIEKWLQELQAGSYASVPKIFVGNKKDLRELDNPQHLQEQAIIQILKGKGVKYLSCSAKTMDGINELFETAATLSLQSLKKEINEKNSGQPNQNYCCNIY